MPKSCVTRIIGYTGLGLYFFEEFQVLRLDGDVQGGGRFIGDEQARHTGHANGATHPLSHTAAELMGIVAQARFRSGNAQSGQGSRTRWRNDAPRRPWCKRTTSATWVPTSRPG